MQKVKYIKTVLIFFIITTVEMFMYSNNYNQVFSQSKQLMSITIKILISKVL